VQSQGREQQGAASCHDIMVTCYHGDMQAMSASVASAYGCTAQVDWMQETDPYYPPVVNDPRAAQFAASVAAGLFGTEKVGMS